MGLRDLPVELGQVDGPGGDERLLRGRYRHYRAGGLRRGRER